MFRSTTILIGMAVLLLGTGCKDPDAGSSGSSAASGRSAGGAIDYQSIPENTEYTFIIPNNSPIDGYNHQALLLLKNYLEGRSSGRIGVKLYPNGTLASTVDEGINGLIDGNFQVFQTTGDVAAYWTPMSVFDLPYMLADERVAEAVFTDAEFIGQLRKGMLDAQPNIRLMMVTNSGGWRNFGTTKKPILRPGDVQGMKIRTVPSETQQQLVSILGGAPTGITWGEVYTALSTGVAEGSKNGIIDVVAAKLHESIKHYTLDGHAYMAGYWWMDQGMYESLPADLKMVVNDGFAMMQSYLFSFQHRASVEAYGDFRSLGGTVYGLSAEEIKAFKDATAQPMEDWYLDKYGEEVKPWLDRYKAVIARQEELLGARRVMENTP